MSAAQLNFSMLLHNFCRVRFQNWIARGRRAVRRGAPWRLDLRPGGRRASRSQGLNVIFSEPPTAAATPLLGAAALSGGALPGGSICGPAAGARAGARGDNVIFGEPPTGAATPLLGAA